MIDYIIFQKGEVCSFKRGAFLTPKPMEEVLYCQSQVLLEQQTCSWILRTASLQRVCLAFGCSSFHLERKRWGACEFCINCWSGCEPMILSRHTVFTPSISPVFSLIRLIMWPIPSIFALCLFSTNRKTSWFFLFVFICGMLSVQKDLKKSSYF